MDADDQNAAVRSADALLTAIAWQDHLLQTYRTIHLLVLVGLLTPASAMVVGCWLVPTDGASAVAFVGVAAMTVVAIWIGTRLRGLVAARARDVDFWQARALTVEQGIRADERHLTAFKLHQKGLAPPMASLDGEEVAGLLGKGAGHTRRLVDHVVPQVLTLLWASLPALALLGIVIG